MERDPSELCEGCGFDLGYCECVYCDECSENIDLGNCYCEEETEQL